jgi:hypothetical protein
MDKIEYHEAIKFFVKEGLMPNEIHSKFIKSLWGTERRRLVREAKARKGL